MTQWIVEVVEGDDPGRQLPLANKLVIGRERGADILVADPETSRRHAQIELGPEGPSVEDLQSRNGTYVNDQIVHGRRRLEQGDQIRAGLNVFELRTQEQVAARPSAVGPRPDITRVGPDVLQPASTRGMPARADAVPGLAEFMVEESEPAFVSEEVVKGLSSQPGGYEALTSLVDARVKRQTSVAAFALLAIAALAVIIYFGIR